MERRAVEQENVFVLCRWNVEQWNRRTSRVYPDMPQVKLKWAGLAFVLFLVLIFRSLILNFKCLRAALCSNAGGSQRQEREQKKIRHTFLLPETEILHCMEMIR